METISRVDKYKKYQKQADFIKTYSAASNAATGSKFDSNTNVDSKNISTLDSELPKEQSIGINRLMMASKLTEMDGEWLAEKYLEQLENHEIYCHDESHVLMPYCVSVTLYPFLLNGLTSIGGISTAPKHLDSFCGEFINLVFAIAAQFAGAVSTPEWLAYMDYFIRKKFGDDYYLRYDEVVDLSAEHKTIGQIIEDKFQQVVHSLNQPASARGFQSVFWNIAYFDENYFNALFDGFAFPDGTPMQWKSVCWLQKYFMAWFNVERCRTVLTYPVESVSILHNGVEPLDRDCEDWVCESWAKGSSFFCYLSDSVDSLSSCCFDGKQECEIKHDGHYLCDTFEYIYDNYHDVKLAAYRHGKWVGCNVIRLPANRVMYEIETQRGDVLRVTDNHIFPTFNGDKKSRDIAIGDRLTWDDLYFARDKTDSSAVHPDLFDVVKSHKYKYKGDWVYCLEMDDENDPYFTLPGGIISHNCRLRNGIEENTFSYTLGAGGISTGSKKVITININRLVQNATRAGKDISEAVREQTELVHKYLLAYNELLKDLYNAHMLPVYEAGYISLAKQYQTVGLSGFVCGAEFLGIEISDNEEYRKYGEAILKPIYELNKAHRTKDVMFNTEFVPAENLGIKNAQWDHEDGYVVPRDCYNSYFYRVEDETCNPIDKLILHGKQFTQYLDGGSAVHINLAEHLSKEQYRQMLRTAIKTGANYITYNIPNTVCNECGHIDKRRLKACPNCGSEDVDYLTRVIGYLKRVKHNFSEARQKEESRRYYAGGDFI